MNYDFANAPVFIVMLPISHDSRYPFKDISIDRKIKNLNFHLIIFLSHFHFVEVTIPFSNSLILTSFDFYIAITRMAGVIEHL